MKSTVAFTILFCYLISNPSICQSIWSEADQAAYMTAKSDSTTWDMTMLQEDLEWVNSDDSTITPALSDYPSPVSNYDWGYCALGNQELEIDGFIIEGKFIGYAKDEYRKHLLIDSSDYYINYFNIFYITDLTDDDQPSSANTIVSRNYPHYLTTGKQKTSMGSIDWVQMNMADGQNFLIINQRYYDLKYGKTILVAPLKDGSLRILQINDDMGSINSKTMFKERIEGNIQSRYKYIDRLQNNPLVKTFFTQDQLLK